MAFLRGLEKAPTFLVPIINPPFADNSPHQPPSPGGGGFIPKENYGCSPTSAQMVLLFIPTVPFVIPAIPIVIPTLSLVIPAKAGIQATCRSGWIPRGPGATLSPLSTAAGPPGFAVLIREANEGGLARGSTSAVLARGYKHRASGEPKAHPLTIRRYRSIGSPSS